MLTQVDAHYNKANSRHRIELAGACSLILLSILRTLFKTDGKDCEC